MGIIAFPVIDLAATGANITRLRKEHGYTVADLQEFFGFEAPQAIYKWQAGKTLPSTDNLFALSRFLGVTIEDILVAEKPKFQVLPQDDSCGSGFFGETFNRYLRRWTGTYGLSSPCDAVNDNLLDIFEHGIGHMGPVGSLPGNDSEMMKRI